MPSSLVLRAGRPWCRCVCVYIYINTHMHVCTHSHVCMNNMQILASYTQMNTRHAWKHASCRIHAGMHVHIWNPINLPPHYLSPTGHFNRGQKSRKTSITVRKSVKTTPRTRQRRLPGLFSAMTCFSVEQKKLYRGLLVMWHALVLSLQLR